MLKLKFLVRLLVIFCVFSSQKLIGQAKPVEQQNQRSQSKKNTKTLFGQASYYSQKFEGRKTASGQIFRHKKFTAACNTLPLGTYIKVTNLKNGKTVIVQTNDRLHVKTKRLIDLTLAGAKRLGFVASGITRVKVEVLGGKKDKIDTADDKGKL